MKMLLLDLEVAAGHDVVDHAHAFEQRQVLEGAAMPISATWREFMCEKVYGHGR